MRIRELTTKDLAQTIYEDALKKLEWHTKRGNEERVDEWATLAGHLEHLYGLRRPEHLK